MTDVIIPREAINEIYIPYLKQMARVQIYFGGASSGKSVFLAQRDIIDVMKGGRNILVCRQVGRTLRGSVVQEITKIIKEWGLSDLFHTNKTDGTVTCTNGYQIIFSGLDDVEKLKSVTPALGVFTDIRVDEATETIKDSLKQLIKRQRGGDKNTKKRLVLSFNPIIKSHFLYADYFANLGWADDQKEYTSPALSILKTTYRDNKFLTPDDIYDLESETDEYYKSVYTDGNWGILGGTIFTNWRVEDLSGMTDQFTNKRNGLDFGFSSDPASVVVSHYDKMRKVIYIHKELYETGLTNDILAERVKELIPDERIVADSSEPKSIQELNNHGVYAAGAKKGKDSVNFGIDWLKQQTIIVDKSCINMQNELSQYHWKKDAGGNSLKVPVDKNNHCFAPESLVYTTRGKKRIDEMIGTSGYVYSRNGTIMPYSNVRATRIDTDVLSFLFDDGQTLTVTPDHLLLSIDGSWIEADLINTGYMIQSGIFNTGDENGKANISEQRISSLQWGKIFQSWYKKIAPRCLGVLQRRYTERNARSPYRRELQEQRYFEPRIDKPGEAYNPPHDARTKDQSAVMDKENTRNGEGVARIFGGFELALKAWFGNLDKQKGSDGNLWSLQKRVSNSISNKVEILWTELQNESAAKKVVRITRGRRDVTYNMDVEQTHCLLVNGVIAHNCIDALRYAYEGDMEDNWLVS